MTPPTTWALVELLRSWASSSPEVLRVLLAGSITKELDCEGPIGQSDIDVIIYIAPNRSSSQAIENLTKLSIGHGILIHTLIIHHEDAEMKSRIPEYKHMIGTARRIYETSK